MGAEDFAFYSEKVPGVFVFLGVMNEEKGACYAQHHQNFNIDEDALEIGTGLHVQYALDFLNENLLSLMASDPMLVSQVFEGRLLIEALMCRFITSGMKSAAIGRI